MVKLDPQIEHLVLDSGTIETTPNHPYFSADRGWVDAGELAIGEQIRTDSGANAIVLSYTVEATPTPMWDITVEDAHSFFVGQAAVLVHNCAVPAGGGSATQRIITEQLDDATLDAARREAMGEVVAVKPNGMPYDHIPKVQAGQQGLLNRIEELKAALADAYVTGRRDPAALISELSQASRHLDYSETFLPR
jgi:hypothetical protein